MHVKIDAIDRDLIRLLQRNSKSKIYVLSDKLGIPPSTVHHRIKRLEESGVIKNWTVRLDYSQLGMGIRAHVLVYVDPVRLRHKGRTQRDVARALSKVRGVEFVDIIAGDADLLVCLRARDVKDLESLLMDKVQSVDGVVKTKTLVSLEEFCHI